MNWTLDALRRADDLDLGASDWIEMHQERIDAFAEVTEDRQWIHTDPERAAETPFGTTIAHGFLLLAMVPRLFTEIFQVPEAEMLVNYGIDKVRFIQPVPSGAFIRLNARVVSATPKGDNLLLRIRGNLVLRDDDRERRAVAVETLFLVVTPTTEAGAPSR